jgi:hypothetical protein
LRARANPLDCRSVTRAPAEQERSRARWRAFAFALTVVFGLAQALPVLHFVLVAHRLCAEHGEMLHAAEVDDAASHASDVRPGPAPETRLVASANEAHQHEHCGVVVSSHSHGVGLTGPASTNAVLSQVTSADGSARTAHASIALLLYAPKLAPPASV